MDFTTRQVITPSTNRFSGADEEKPPTDNKNNGDRQHKPEKFKHKTGWIQAVLIFFLLCLLALIVALLLTLGFGKREDSSKYVNTGAYQAVAIANPGAGQPTYYFGNISYINNNYLVLNNAYTLVPKASPARVTSLACADVNNTNQLVINREQVLLWDNLNSNSDVVKAIQLFNSDNPNGNCPAPAEPTTPTNNPNGSTNSTNSSTKTPNQPTGSNPSSTNTQPATNNSTGSTGTTSPKQP